MRVLQKIILIASYHCGSFKLRTLYLILRGYVLKIVLPFVIIALNISNAASFNDIQNQTIKL
jgi:hypothetical protein